MKKKYIIFYMFLIIILTSTVIIFKSSKKLKEDVKLKNQIIETIKKSDSIDLEEITDFKWDTMYVFTPYSNPWDVLKQEGIKRYNSNFNIQYLDSIYMIAFIGKNKLISFIELPKDCVEVNSIIPIKVSKSEAKFNVDKNKGIIILNKK